MTKNDRKRVDAFEMWCYRRLLQVSWKDKKTNVWVLEKIGTDLTIRRRIMERKLNYLGTLLGDLKVLRSKYCKEQSKENGVEVVHQYPGLMISRKCLDKESEAADPGGQGGHSAPHFFKYPKSAPFSMGKVPL